MKRVNRLIRIKMVILCCVLAISALAALPPPWVVWPAYVHQGKINEKWQVVADFQYRTRPWFSSLFQGVVRSGVVYQVNSNCQLAAGFADFQTYQQGDITMNEVRLWQELGCRMPIGKFFWSNKLRWEKRWFTPLLADQLDWEKTRFANRWRWRSDIRNSLPLFPNLQFAVGTEYLWTKDLSGLYLSQWRYIGGLTYKWNANWSFMAEYMRVKMRAFAGDAGIRNNTLKLYVIHSINWKPSHGGSKK